MTVIKVLVIPVECMAIVNVRKKVNVRKQFIHYARKDEFPNP